MVARRRIVWALAVLLVGGGVGFASPVSAATPLPLVVPSATAFAILGHSCGGIQQQVLAVGFDHTSGHPTGDVYLQTRCNGSGRGGRTTTYDAWVAVSWNVNGDVVGDTVLTTPPSGLNPSLAVYDSRGDELVNQLSAVNVAPANCTPSNVTYCTYRAYLTLIAPGQPTLTAVDQSADSLHAAWTKGPKAGPIGYWTVIATPSDGSAPLIVVVSAGALAASVPGVAPSTTYAVTVSGGNIMGSGPSSAAVDVTTAVATVPPGAPTGLTAGWTSSATAIQATWLRAAAGNSPTDDYQVEVTRRDPPGAPSDHDAGTALTLTVPGLNGNDDWAVKVRAHNAAGWGAWSATVVVPSN